MYDKIIQRILKNNSFNKYIKLYLKIDELSQQYLINESDSCDDTLKKLQKR